MGALTPALRVRTAKEQGGRCFYCGLRMEDDLTWEHLVARADGGTDRISNMRVTHAKCNSLVGTLPYMEKMWLAAFSARYGSDAFFLAADVLLIAHGKRRNLAGVGFKPQRRPKKMTIAERRASGFDDRMSRVEDVVLAMAA